MLRAVVIVLTASLSLVLLPIAINVGTGGTAPAFLAPYVAWTWPAIGVLWLILVVTALAEIRSRQRPTISSRSADVPRNRQLLLRSVDTYVNQRVAVSLAARTRLALALDERPQAVVRPYDLFVQPIDSEPRQLPENAEIAAVFDELQDSMLILGAPGAGKTTLLLSLARTLADQAATDERTPIPVLIDLASWAATPSRRSDDHPRDSPLLAGFVRWLLAQLNLRYGVPPAVGRSWLLHGRFALLLDGLDEIDRPHRDKLAGVLSELQTHYTIPKLAVTCRTHDYEQLDNQLVLSGAVHIRPLTRQQVLEYFEAVGPALDGARAAIEQDDELWDLVTSPLMLNVLLLAYQDRVPEEIAASETEDVRRDLFDTFIAEVLSRNRTATRQYGALAAVRALHTLAFWTVAQSGNRTAVPRWLLSDGLHDQRRPRELLSHLRSAIIPAAITGFVAGAIMVTVAEYGVLAGLAVIMPVLAFVNFRRSESWQLDGLRTLRSRLVVPLATTWMLGALSGVVLVLAGSGLVDRGAEALGLRSTFASGVVIGLVVMQGLQVLTTEPRQWSGYNRQLHLRRWANLWMLGTAVVAYVLAVLLGADLTPVHHSVVPGLLVGALVNVLLPRRLGWRGMSLRAPLRILPYRLHEDAQLRWEGYLPWRRRPFHEYAADRFILARTGPREYSFIHLLIRDHLAYCNPDLLAAKVDRRAARR